MRKLRVGLAGLMQKNFAGDKVGMYHRSAAALETLQDQLGFELHAVKEGIYAEEDAAAAKREFADWGADLILLQNSSFAPGALATVLAKTDAYLGLWAVPEPTQTGPLLLNSFCGMNMNNSIISEYAATSSRPVKWFYGNVADSLFRDRFEITVKALTAVVNLRAARLALIGGIADGFNDLYFDERKLQGRFGVSLHRNHEFSEIKDRMLAYHPQELQDAASALMAEASFVSSEAEVSMGRNVALHRALKEIAHEGGYDGLAVSCWPKFRTELDMVACAALGRLNEEGIPAACEGDVYGLLSMLVLRYLTGGMAMLLDLVDFDETDQTIQLWHCGVGCKSLAHKGRVKLANHFNPTLIPGREPVPAAPVAEMVIAPHEATAARFTKEGDSLFLLTGAFDRPEKGSFDGSRGWLGRLRMEGQPILVRDLVNSIMIHKVPHHYAMVLGDVSDAMREMAGWLGIREQKRVEYRDHLQLGACPSNRLCHYM